MKLRGQTSAGRSPKIGRWTYAEQRKLIDFARSTKKLEEVAKLLRRSSKATERQAKRLGISLSSEPMAKRNWQREFDRPILLPKGRELRSLIDADRYIKKLHRQKRQRPEWRIAIRVLLMAAEGHMPVTVANIALLMALNGGKRMRPKGPRRKAIKKHKKIR
jgi:hypothetical protein